MSGVSADKRRRVLAICGGVGGAKLALGLYKILPACGLAVAVNTGDDFEHLGLSISPDIDTVLYTLAGLADPVRGWGRKDETWNFMESLRQIEEEKPWFRLGDRDLALHVARTHFLREGGTLSEFTSKTARAYGIDAGIFPMSNDCVRTVVDTDAGPLPFQRYFVERRCTPAVSALRFEGAEHAHPMAGLLGILSHPDLQAIVICPSNPYLSIDPILAVPGFRTALANAEAPIVAVSPIIGGQAVKGPTTKIMAELGVSANVASIAAHYRGLIDGLVVDAADEAEAARLDCPTLVTSTLMKNLSDREGLARDVVAFAHRLANVKRPRLTRAAS